MTDAQPTVSPRAQTALGGPAYRSPGLLVSVRSAAEAHAAIGGGATLIDVKEPQKGSLGRATDDIIASVVTAVGGRRAVSAALGELIDDAGESVPAGLAYVKWGLAGYGADPAWRAMLASRRGCGPVVVLVAYADWQCARAPSLEQVFACAVTHPASILLVDTHCKDAATQSGRKPTLLDWLPAPHLAELCRRCRAAAVGVALAGSLGPAEIRELAPAAPDWFAVRGAVCEGGRDGVVDAARVRGLVELIAETYRPARDAC